MLLKRYDYSSDRREDDSECALPQCSRFWTGCGIRPAWEDGNGGNTHKLDLTPWDVGMVVADVALAMATKDALIRQGVLPPDIIK